jgi:hypothetical protein
MARNNDRTTVCAQPESESPCCRFGCRHNVLLGIPAKTETLENESGIEQASTNEFLVQ